LAKLGHCLQKLSSPTGSRLISITVTGHRHELIQDKTSLLTLGARVQQGAELFVVAMRVINPDRLSVSFGFQKRRQLFVGI
jgi:hypothetical protein